MGWFTQKMGLLLEIVVVPISQIFSDPKPHSEEKILTRAQNPDIFPNPADPYSQKN